MARKEKKLALVFGSTGFIGSRVLQLLRDDDRYSQVKIYNRRPSGMDGGKVVEIITDYSDLPALMKKKDIHDAHVYCTIGTTIKKAGSREAFRNIDYGIPLAVANAAGEKAEQFMIITSMGAWADSPNHYLKTKGEVEEDLEKILGDRVHFFRPSILMGKRDEFRGPEEVGKIIMKVIGPLFMGPLKKFKGIDGEVVAAGMIQGCHTPELPKIVESDMIQELGSEYIASHE